MLIISLRRGESFYVGDQRVQLKDFDGERAILKTKGRSFDCPNTPAQLPGQDEVQVSAGLRQEFAVRIGIQAPFEIKILREKLWRRAQHGRREPEERPNRHHARAMGCKCKGLMMTRMSDGVWVKCPAAQDPSLPLCDPID